MRERRVLVLAKTRLVLPTPERVGSYPSRRASELEANSAEKTYAVAGFIEPLSTDWPSVKRKLPWERGVAGAGEHRPRRPRARSHLDGTQRTAAESLPRSRIAEKPLSLERAVPSRSRGDRTFKLGPGTTSEPGRYVKSLWGSRDGQPPSTSPRARPGARLGRAS